METPTARITSDWSIEAQVPREFLARPHGSNGWCRRSENVEAFKHGDFRAVKPETLELCVANRCNKNCHFCTYAGCKVCQKLLPVGKYGQPNDVEAMSLATARRVIVEAKKAGVKGVLITGNGGDPGVCIDTPAIMEFSAENGMATMVYSNAIMWGVNYELAKRTLSPRNSVVCIRGSYNEATARVARHLAGIGSERLDLEYRGYRHVLQARDQLLQEYDVSKGSPPAVMTSIVVSERNVEDLLPICERIAAIYSSTAQYHGPFDDCVCRCATDHSRGNYEKHDHATKMVDRMLAVVEDSRQGRRAMDEAGMA